MRDKIMEPGFTTKGDDGSGMGLYIVKQTLQENNGSINIESAKGRTRFFGVILGNDKLNTQNDI